MSSRDSLVKSTKAKLARYCSMGERSPAQVYKKLSSAGLYDNESQEVIAFLRKEKFLDEERFASAFCNDKLRFNKWGKTRIKMELYAHKIADDIIFQSLASIDEEVYQDILAGLLHLKWNQLIKEENPLMKKKKTLDFAMRKGFSVSDIQPLLASMIRKEEESQNKG